MRAAGNPHLLRTLSVMADRPPLTDIAGVRYIGTSDVRIVNGYDLAKIGISPAEHDLVWTYRGAVAPVGSLSAAVVDHLLTDPDFELVLKEDDGAS